MKKLILMRHAKSDWSNSGQSDHARPLNKRGISDVPRMAQELLNRGILPELILVSDSARTRQTWELLTQILGAAPTRFLPDLYLASATEIKDIVKSTDSLIDTVMVIAHNPGITDAYQLLANVQIDNVPTAGLGCISFDCDKYENLTATKATLNYFVYPKGV
jgi:phosphohistidine phosphatase